MRVIQEMHQFEGEMRPVQPSPEHEWDSAQWRLVQVAETSPGKAVISEPTETSVAIIEDPVEDSAIQERKWRQSVLAETQWLLARHRDEQELGRVTMLTAKQYLELLEYRQALRDWPVTTKFPLATERPAVPASLVSIFSSAN
ncbi:MULTISPECIES: phage tail assembly chaperone [Pseudomonas]|uniref:phage tail assembly chaperone n=1 Tax=Pseudomonas TaxID=286 RepID=UPI002361A10E|nr:MULTISPECIES: phage tail assembly chaperone [Pseudomonas]